ncbi:MAG: FxsA family protein [Planctomycetes bacterium]|nr:FxsA family protein [Planctomycetota bacterium]
MNAPLAGLAAALVAAADAGAVVAALRLLPPGPGAAAVVVACFAAVSLIGGALGASRLAAALRQLRADLAAGAAPIASGTDAALLAAAFLLFLAPGVLTDLVALALLLPTVRERLKVRAGMALLRARMARAAAASAAASADGPATPSSPASAG